MTWSTKCRLISADPVTCARHFDYSVHQFFNTVLKSPVSPFGKLADFWYRIEFQHRGSPHVHCLLWLTDVPVYGVDDDEKVISYIDSVVTCQRTWDNSELSNLVNLQVHMHTRTCKKQFRKRTVCRFDFPKLPMSQTQILQPLADDEVDRKIHSDNFLRIKSLLSQFKPDCETLTMDEFLKLVDLDLDAYLLAIRSSLRSPTVYVKRAVNEVRVNNYNVHCLHAWRANMDIQFILDVYACASYITSYVAKSERGMSELLRSACQEAKQGNVNLKQQVRIIGNKFVNNVEVSAQEAVYQLLQMPLKRSSRQVVFLNTSPPEERVYLLKSNLDLLPDDADIAASNVITRYVSRAPELENVCFADYAALHDKVNTTSHRSIDDEHNDDDTDANTSQLLKTRKTARVIRFVNFNAVADAEKSAREKLMLNTHWRNEHTHLYGGFQSFVEHFQAVKPTLKDVVQNYESFCDEVTFAEESLTRQQVEEQWDLLAPGVMHSDTTEQDAGVCESECHAALHPDTQAQTSEYDLAIDLGLGRLTSSTETSSHRYDMSDDDYFTLMKSLNHQQLEFIYDTLHCVKMSRQPVYRFLSGGAATGKSYVLRALRESAERYFRSRAGANHELHWTMTVAPTGKAAFLIGGSTIHSVFHVPANQSLNFKRLDHESLNSLRSQIGHVKLWFIDEISMVGHKLFSFIDQRLQELNNTNLPFGGTSVVVFGDLFQLPPVIDGFVFEDFSLTKSNADQYSVLAPNLWVDLFTMFELTQVVRQQDCTSFAEVLNRLREGIHTPGDVETLQSRLISPEVPHYPTSAQHLFKTNAQVEQYNSQMYNSSTLHKLVVTCVDSVVGAVSDDMAHHILHMIPQDSRKTAQLADRIALAVGGRYEISVNINVGDGLANGAGGLLKKIQLTSANNTASGIIWMHFDDAAIGAQTRIDSRSLYRSDISTSWTPLQPLSRQFQVGKGHSSQVLRKQFPVRQSSTKTIHRCQGDTLDQVVVDLTSKRREPHSHYVALSRVKTLDGLFILNLNPEKIHVSENVKREMAELRSARQTELSLHRPYLESDTCYHIGFLNVRSLHKHVECVRKDHFIMACDVNLFCETCTSSSDASDYYHLADFNCVLYSDNSTDLYRSHYGLSLYSKSPILFSHQVTTLSEQTSHHSVECVFTTAAVHPKLLLKIACVYRRPNSKLLQFQKAIQTLLTDLSMVECDDSTVQVHTVIVGDFNLDWGDQSTRTMMSELIPSYRQLVTDVTTDYTSPLDHVYTTLPENTVHCFTTECYFTDHKFITVCIHT